MPPITRRRFIRTMAAGIGALALEPLLSGCRPEAAGTTSPPPGPTAAPPVAKTIQPRDPTASPTGEPAQPPTASPAPTAALPDLVAARSGEPGELVRRALIALGGMPRFVPRGAQVIIKPNICTGYHTYEYAATTNPWVVGALVSLCLEAGASRVQVLDFPFGSPAAQAYEKSGIAEQVRLAGGEMVEMARFKFLPTELPQAKSLRTAAIYDDVLNAPVLINVPIAKHHSLARLTLGMKNLMGVILEREAIHRDLGQRLADLAWRVRPTLTVVDAVRILTDHGPTGGSLDDVQQIDTVIASPDIVAADAYAAGLFGLRPDDLDYVRAGAELGLGRSDLAAMRIEELTVGG